MLVSDLTLTRTIQLKFSLNRKRNFQCHQCKLIKYKKINYDKNILLQAILLYYYSLKFARRKKKTLVWKKFCTLKIFQIDVSF